MRRLVLLRHGQTGWNASGRAQGHCDIELDETGHLQAKLAAPALAAYAPSLLWSSDLLRARQTAEYVAAETGLTPVLDARLREYAVGEHRMGLTIGEYAEQFPDEHAHLLAGRTHLIPGRETAADIVARFVPAIDELVGVLGDDETAVVVTHGAALKVATIAFLGWPAEVDTTLGGLDNCGWLELVETTSSWHGGGLRWRLASYNVKAQDPDFAS